MTRNELIKNISVASGVSQANCEKILDAFTYEITQCLVRGDKILLKNFVSFEATERPARNGRDPKTGNVTSYPATKSVKCKISKTIKDAINQK